jgi:NAD(P)-dependent dehydrogenase (short-subunit alcohol dehydrogenase family)
MSASSATLIVGASRGLGLGLVREFLSRGRRVIATVRDARQPGALAELSGPLRIESVDVAHAESIAALRRTLEGESLDILMVNAGVGDPGAKDFATAFHACMSVNALGAMTAVKALFDLVQPGGALAVMSSQLGSIANNTTGGQEPYRASKAALNQSLRSFAAEHAAAEVSFTCVHPGWVKTDMGGPHAPIEVETSVRGVADVLEGRLGKRGDAFLDYRGETLPW